MFVKICGMTSRAAVDAAVEAGADAIGFVFAPSPREVTPDTARMLCAGLPAGIVRVAVMRHPSVGLVERVAEALAPDWLQTDAEDFDRFELPAGCVPLPVYRNGRLPATLAAVPGPLADALPRLLFEGEVSGSGRTADWLEARQLAARARLVLAGGLNADNVEDAIRAVAPWGVDVSSGVERAPGVKDPDRIREFVARARAAATPSATEESR